MKNDKRKNQNKNSKKKKTAHLEESLREKLFELVRSLGHDVVDVSEEIFKMSKRLTKKLSKKMKDAMTTGDDAVVNAETTKSKFTAVNKKKKDKKSEVPANETIKSGIIGNQKVTHAAKKTPAVVNAVKKQIPTKAKTIASGSKNAGASSNSATKSNLKSDVEPTSISQKAPTSKKPEGTHQAKLKTPQVAAKKAESKSTVKPAVKKASTRKPTTSANKKPVTPAETLGGHVGEVKKRPGRPRSVVKDETQQKLKPTDIQSKSTVVTRPTKSAPKK